MIDKRRHFYAVIDTETAGDLDNPLIFDFAIAVCDRAGKIYFKQNWIVEEIFNDLQTMETAYYFSKYPKYKEMLEQNPNMLKSLWDIRREIKNIIAKWNVKTVCAYNLRFDFCALQVSAAYVGMEDHYFFPYSMQKQDIWSLFCDTIAKQKTFRNFAISNRHYKDNGTIRTSAEIAYRYLTNNKKFEEAHTALADVEIEVEILARCLAQHKKYRRGAPNWPSSILPKVTDLDKLKAKAWRGSRLTKKEKLELQIATI